MLTWHEIIRRYNLIKDHKPRLSTKLDELGEILSAAYLEDPPKANEMWKYLIDLNTQDKNDYAQYYVAQVYRKLAYKLGPEKATCFLAMDVSRIHLLIHHGYEGYNGFYQSLYYALGYAIIINDKILTKIILDELETKSSSAKQSRFFKLNVERTVVNVVTSLYPEEKPSFWGKASDTSFIQEYWGVNVDNISEFCLYCIERFQIDEIRKPLIAYNAIIKLNCIQDRTVVFDLLYYLLEIRKYSIFSDFLFLERDIVAREVTALVLEYVEKSPQGLPLDYLKNRSPFHAEKVAWYRRIVTNSSTLLSAVFSKSNGHTAGFLEEYLNELIETSEWSSFEKYFSLAISSEDTADRQIDYCLEYIKSCIDYYVCGEGTERPTSHRLKVATLTIPTWPPMSDAEEAPKNSFSRLSSADVDRFISALEYIASKMENNKYYDELNSIIQDLKSHKKQSSEKKTISNSCPSKTLNKVSPTAKYKGSSTIPNTFNIYEYLYYYSHMEVLFDLRHIDPLEGDKSIIEKTLSIVECFIDKKSYNASDLDESVVYFVNRWINPKNNCWNLEDFLDMKRKLEKLKEYIEKYFAGKNADKI